MAQELALGVITGFPVNPLQDLTNVRDLGIPTIQLSYPELWDTPQGIEAIRQAVAETGVEITTVFCGFEGERYDDIPTVKMTVGYVPELTRHGRLEKTRRIAKFARTLGVSRVAAHIGFIPEDEGDPLHKTMVEALRGICEDVKANGQVFALETGQETAAGLRRFIQDVGVDNLRVNFDPANMILYGNDRPIPALDILAPWIDGVHFKDGTWPTEPGKLGVETALGEGEVDIPAWTQKLLSLGYRGPLTIEREIHGEQQRLDILRAKALIEELVARYR
jgi:sugar phosphate isomerase/epimerase